MRSIFELNAIENFINGAYNRYGNSLRVKLNKPFSPESPELGYTYKFKVLDTDGDRELVVYNVVCAPTGIERTDYRIKMHEYGHIYLGHLDGLHEELDVRICNVFRDFRGELIEQINKNCGIDFAEKLIERVIDDPILNHSLHNIAMDMEVNTKILSEEDIAEIETDISSILPKSQEQGFLENLSENIDNLTDLSEEEKNQLRDSANDRISELEKEAKIKLILPSRYHFPDETPFPNEQTYPEYLVMIIKNLDQFVKMLVSIKCGGNGDTSEVTSEDVKNLLDKMGGGNSEKGLDKLMEEMGMSDPKPENSDNQDGDPQQVKEGEDELKPHDISNTGGYKGSSQKREDRYQGRRMDHGSTEREEADKKRSLGKIVAGGGIGCSNTGTSVGTREVDYNVDPVDEAIDEVIANFKHKVVKRTVVRDVMKNYNRGINRKVIAPSVVSKVDISFDPKIVYLIDISGSMDTCLVDRILATIAKKMKRCGTGRGLKYDIISWNTSLGEHIKDIDPKKKVPRIHTGGGTRLGKGIKYFRENYDPSAILVIISDFEDYLEEWANEESKMKNYTLYGFNYGRTSYDYSKFKNLKVKDFNEYSRNSW